MITKKIIFMTVLFLLLVIPITLAEESQLFFSIILGYDSGTITKEEVKLIQSIGEVDKKGVEGDYVLKVYSFNEDLLYETNFNFDLEIFNVPPKEWFDDEGNQIYIPNKTEVEPVQLEKTKIVIFVPYFRNTKTVRVFKDDELKLEFNLSEYAICNMNSVCDEKESYEQCPEDCAKESIKPKLSFWQWLINLIKSIF